MQLYIGNKNYSSWSLRPWLLMTHAGIPFEEKKVRLGWEDDSPFKKTMLALAPTGRVPLLIDDGFADLGQPGDRRVPWPSAFPTSSSGRAIRSSGRGRAASAPRCTRASASCAAPSA